MELNPSLHPDLNNNRTYIPRKNIRLSKIVINTDNKNPQKIRSLEIVWLERDSWYYPDIFVLSCS